MGSDYSWTSIGSGAWADPSNWFDTTTGTAASVPPGSADTALIDAVDTTPMTIEAPADVGKLTVDGEITLAGNFSVGALTFVHAHVPPRLDAFRPHTANIVLAGSVIANSVTVGSLFVFGGSHSRWMDSGIVHVGTAAALAAASVTVTGGDLEGDGGTVAISHELDLGELIGGIPGGPDPLVATGALDVTNHGSVSVGIIVMNDGSVSLDATSTLEVGHAGTAAAGTITVDPGGLLATTGFYFASRTPKSPSVAVFGPVLNNGRISGDFNLSDVINNGVINLRIGGLDNGVNNGIVDIQRDGTLRSLINNGSINLQLAGTLDNIVNNGSIEVDTGTVTAISGGGLLDFTSLLTVGPGVSDTVTFRQSPVAAGTLAIALGAGIAVDASDTPRIAGFASEDAIVVQGVVADAAHYERTGTDIGTLTLDEDGAPVASLTLLGNYQNFEFAVAGVTGGSAVGVTLTCFAAGTRIATDRGDARVEHLCVGDLVATRNGCGFRPVRWLGFRTVDATRHPDRSAWSPVRIAADAFGVGLPRRALYLSPDHAVFADGVLIPVKYLVNGDTIRQVHRRSITYWHVELDTHDVVFAEGLAVESYLDTGDRANFANGSVVARLHPSFTALTWEAHGCAPLVVAGPVVTTLRRRLRRRAIALRNRMRKLAA